MNELLNSVIENFLTALGNPYFYVFMVFFIIFLIGKKLISYRLQWLYFLLIFPGTFMHELAHFIVGILFGAKPKNFSLLPKRTDKGYTLGSVSFTNINFVNALPIGLAPLLLLPIAVYLFNETLIVINHKEKISFFFLLVQSYIIYTLLLSFMPSRADFKVSFGEPVGLIFYGIIIYLVFFL